MGYKTKHKKTWANLYAHNNNNIKKGDKENG
jgi:hypothetical protein